MPRISLPLYLAAFATPCLADTWAVLAAGSNTFWNYRHQADVCHAYQILRRNGVDAEKIIVLMYDDVANGSGNPFPGKLFNQPDGEDVYGGCTVDYRAEALSPDLYLSVLRGDSEAVNGVVGSGKVLRSGPDDHVFVYFADHGGEGMIMFPGGAISASDLLGTLQKMHERSMYKQLVFYLDTCHSGSMFEQLPSDIGVLAVASAEPIQNAYAVYCYPPENVIQGKDLGVCLGDEMSVGWLQDSDTHGQETLGAQIKTVTAWTHENHCGAGFCSSTVCTYGDTTFESEPLSMFQGSSSESRAVPRAPATGINARDVKLELLRHRLEAAANSAEEAELRQQLQAELGERENVDRFFEGIEQAACGGRCNVTRRDAEQFGCSSALHRDLKCHKTLIDTISSPDCPAMAWGDYSGKYAGLLANLCDQRNDLDLTTTSLVELIRSQCEASSVVV